MTLLQFLPFLALNIGIGISALLITLALNKFETPSREKLVLQTATAYFALIITTEIALGIFGQLTYINLALLNATITIILLGTTGRKALKIPRTPHTEIPYIALVIFFLPIAILLLVRLFNALLQIPLETDSIAYHLPFVVEWIKTGDLLTPYYSAFASPISHYPSNYELLDLWFMIPFRNDFFVNLINFPLLILFGTTVYNICRQLKASPNIAVAATALLIYMPVFLRQAGTPLVDLFFSLTFVLAIYFLLEIRANKNDYAPHIFFGLALGLFIGTKYLGIVFGVLPVLLFFIFAKKWLPLFAGLITTTITGAFFYIRNWLDAGNPLFPVDINIFGYHIFDGYFGINEKITSSSLLENVKDLPTLKEFLLNFQNMTGWQIIVIALGIATAIALPFFTRKDRLAGLTLAIAAIIYFILYFKAPYTYRDLTPNVRYSMMFLITGTIATAFIVEKFKKLQLPFFLLTAAALIHSFFFLIFSPPANILYNDKMALDFALLLDYRSEAIFIIFSIFALAFLPLTFKGAHRAIALFLAILFFWQSAASSLKAREELAPKFFTDWYTEDPRMIDLFEAATWFNKNANDAKIAYTGFNFHYHLYGRNLQREVDYININECLNCRYPDYKNSPDSIRRDPNYDNWLANLSAKEKTHLVIAPNMTPNVHSYEFEWAQNHPQKFEQVFAQNDVYVYKINP